jgi:plastocyanin
MQYGTKIDMISQVLLIGMIVCFCVFSISTVYAKELVISIPQGDHTRELKSVIEWYVPINHDVETGNTVTWTNDDITGHTVTSGKGIGFLGDPKTDKAQPDGYFDSGIITPGKSWSFTFKEKGFFAYTCTIHPWVERSITVLEPGIEINNIRISYAVIVTIVAVLSIIGIVVSIVRIRRSRAEKS